MTSQVNKSDSEPILCPHAPKSSKQFSIGSWKNIFKMVVMVPMYKMCTIKNKSEYDYEMLQPQTNG